LQFLKSNCLQVTVEDLRLGLGLGLVFVQLLPNPDPYFNPNSNPNPNSLEVPQSISSTKYTGYIEGIRNIFLNRVKDRRVFNYNLSKARIDKFGGYNNSNPPTNPSFNPSFNPANDNSCNPYFGSNPNPNSNPNSNLSSSMIEVLSSNPTNPNPNSNSNPNPTMMKIESNGYENEVNSYIDNDPKSNPNSNPNPNPNTIINTNTSNEKLPTINYCNKLNDIFNEKFKEEKSSSDGMSISFRLGLGLVYYLLR
jgi:hypothetical protein